MATELGTAYVQIVPSARGISGALQGAVAPEATTAGQSAGSLFGSTMVKVAAGVIAAAGIGKAFSAAIGQGSALQQSLGGIETLFKGSADKVKAYAAEAYRTSGVSANRYMENVTSFSASLISSLGGDTEKAADLANRAMIDMSDNANKMGTDIESIQQTYQSLARGNFAMLDNLKLGYGGTKAELQRLIHDASTYTDVQDELNLSVEDGNMSFGNIVKAISVVQKKLDITGTTAKEAATTFSGSFNSMKAAWEDLLGNIAIGADIGPSLNALATTTSTFLFNNFIPMIGNILKAVPEAITGFISAAAPQVKAGLSSLFDMAGITIDWSGIEGAFGSLLTNLQPVATSIVNMFQDAFSVIGQIAGQLAPAFASVGEMLGSLDFSGISSFIDAIVPSIQGFVQNALSMMMPAIQNIVAAFGKLWNALQPVIRVLADALQPYLSLVGTEFGIVGNVIMNVLAVAFNALADVINFLMPVFQGLGTALGFISNIAQAILVPAFQVLQGVFTAFSEGNSAVVEWFTSLGNALMSNQLVVDAVNLAFQGVQVTITGVGAVFGWLGGVISGIINWFSNLIGNLTGTGSASTTLQSVMQAVWSAIQSAIQVASSIISGAISVIQGVFNAVGGVAQTVQGIISAAWNAVSAVIRTVQGIISGAMSAAGSAFSAFSSVVSGVGSEVGGIVNGIISTIKGLGNINIASAGKAIMDGFIGGLKSTWESGKSFIGGIGNWIKQHKGPISYDRVLLKPAGRAIMGGFNSALMAGFEEVKSNVLGMAPAIANSVNTVMGTADLSTMGNGRLEVALAGSTANMTTGTNREEEIYARLDQLAKRPIVVSNQVDGIEFSRLIATPLTEEQLRRESIENAIYGRGWS